MNDNTEMKSVGEMCEEIKSLRRKVAELEEEIDGDTFWGINQGLKKEKSDLILQQKRMVKEIVELKQKATAWDIVNNGADWENLRDLCDEEMSRDLIKTGECSVEDFEGYLEVEYDSDNEEHSHKCDKCPNNAPDDQQSCGKCR